MGYAPLDFIAKDSELTNEYAILIDRLLQSGVKEASTYTEDELIRFLASEDFMNFEYKGKYSGMNWFAEQSKSDIMRQLGYGPNVDREQIVTEMQDVFLSPFLISRWCRNKQVYKPDADFAEALLSTDEVFLTKYGTEHLPSNIIYVDLEDCTVFGLAGVFVSVIPLTEDVVHLSFRILSKSLILFPIECSFRFTDDVAYLNSNSFGGSGEYIMCPSEHDVTMDENTINKREVVLFCIQLLNYLVSQKPDITEDKVTKKTYKPSNNKAPKNKFSEVQRWEVGVRYGSTVRVYNEERNKKHQESSDVVIQSTSYRKGTKKRPHVRNAHWQRYWTGKGRTVCEVKWIAPIFVGSDSAMETDTVIHKVGAF